MADIANDPRIDPRIKAVLGGMPSMAETDVPDRATLLEEVNRPEAVAQRELMTAMLDIVDSEDIAPSKGLDVSTLEFTSTFGRTKLGNSLRIKTCLFQSHGE